MGLPNSHLQILAAIENELQADPTLAATFSAFTSVTQSAGMPATERLGTPKLLTGWRSFWRTGLPAFLGRMIVPVVIMVAVLVIALTTTVAVLSAGDRVRCEPASAGVRAGYATATCTPLRSSGR